MANLLIHGNQRPVFSPTLHEDCSRVLPEDTGFIQASFYSLLDARRISRLLAPLHKPLSDFILFPLPSRSQISASVQNYAVKCYKVNYTVALRGSFYEFYDGPKFVLR